MICVTDIYQQCQRSQYNESFPKHYYPFLKELVIKWKTYDNQQQENDDPYTDDGDVIWKKIATYAISDMIRITTGIAYFIFGTLLHCTNYSIVGLRWKCKRNFVGS